MSDSSIGVWLNAARPKTLPAAISPVILGIALAWDAGALHFPAALCALMGAILIQIAANYANDYYDYLKGADAGERLGPVRATQAGLVKPAQMKRAMVTVLGLASLSGLYLVYRGGWPILVVGLLSMLFAVLYTAGPYPLGYIGAADLFVLIFFGPVAVAGTYYVQALHLPWTPVWIGLGPGLLSVAILTVNNLRDVNQDRLSGKKTLAVRFGPWYARLQYSLCIIIAVIILPVAAAVHSGHILVCVAILAAAPVGYCVRVVITETNGVTLNDCLARTGKVLLLYSLLFSLGWVLS
ncbi:MAG: 1,4-dihydroxy-2-naphthoate polyprenyltransferase [Candidatus Hydrogenedentes bacterium]|nr:1,4-dihydroxy-2-naphthoate polyprenyltransferase [Candidatus Hydrogenedentota bacterium]